MRLGKNITLKLLILLVILGLYFSLNAFYIESTNEEKSITGYGIETIPNMTSILIIMTHSLYLALACEFIVFIAALEVIRKFKLFWIIIASMIGMVALTGISGIFVHGRYMDCVIPLLIIAGFAYNKDDNKKIRLLLIFALTLVITLTMPMIWKDTINSASNLYTHIWIYAIYILPFLSFVYLSVENNRERYITVIFIVLLVTFSAGNILNYDYLNNKSNEIYELSEIGKFIDKNKITNITFDETDSKDLFLNYRTVNYYSKHIIPLTTEPESNYFISSRELNFKKLVSEKTKDPITMNCSRTLYLYEVNTNGNT